MCFTFTITYGTFLTTILLGGELQASNDALILINLSGKDSMCTDNCNTAMLVSSLFSLSSQGTYDDWRLDTNKFHSWLAGYRRLNFNCEYHGYFCEVAQIIGWTKKKRKITKFRGWCKCELNSWIFPSLEWFRLIYLPVCWAISSLQCGATSVK